MQASFINFLRTVILFAFLLVNYFALSQTSSFPYRDLVKKLSDQKAPPMAGIGELLGALKDKDSSEAIHILNNLESKGNTTGSYFASRFFFAKAIWIWNTKTAGRIDSTQQLVKKALNSAYDTDNDSLVSAIGWAYSDMMYWAGLIEQATMYSLYAAELDEKAGKKSSASQFALLGDLLYKTRDYEKAMYYTKKSIEGMPDTLRMKAKIMSHHNTIGLCWQKMGKYDSAFFYFDIAMKIAHELKDSTWMSIISGNEGQIYFAQKNYPVAKQLLNLDYSQSLKFGETASAANSLQWVARINLIEGKKDSALLKVKEAMRLLSPTESRVYWENVYYAAADAYNALGNKDSAYRYAQLYNQVHEQNERVVANSRLEISRIKLENLQNSLAIKNFHREKQAEELKRNFFIAAIILVTIIAILYVNRLRLKLRHKDQLAAEQQKTANAEIAAAQEQLHQFTQNIIEKTSLIEQLQEQLNHRSFTLEQQELISGISRLTILTEADWEKFKTVFEKIYPGFFINLREKVHDITLAEQRMAALTRLQLSINQIASILGISTNSVYKTKQRLRQRLNLDPEINIEEILNKI